jgi:hypothetical protein
MGIVACKSDIRLSASKALLFLNNREFSFVITLWISKIVLCFGRWLHLWLLVEGKGIYSVNTGGSHESPHKAKFKEAANL